MCAHLSGSEILEHLTDLFTEVNSLTIMVIIVKVLEVKFCFLFISAIGDLDDFGNLPSISDKDIEKLRKNVEKTKSSQV
jgi:hypothetical protein